MAAVEIAPRIVVDEKVCFGKPVIKGQGCLLFSCSTNLQME